MEDIVVRLCSLKLNHIKNVGNGIITMPNTSHKQLNCKKSEILGLYGQNGSGKTAVIDTLYFLQRIMAGASLPDELGDYIDAKDDQAKITADFAVFMDETIYEVSYTVRVRRMMNRSAEILQESLSCARHQAGNRSSKTEFMNYDREAKGVIFTPQKRLNELCEKSKEYKTDLIVAKKIAEKSNCSYIFGESSRDIFCREYHNSFQEYATLIKALFRFAVADLFVIRNTHSGVISANFILPMAFRIDQDDQYTVGLKGDFAISLTEPTILDKRKMDILRRIMEEINLVLYTIIPGLKIGIQDYGVQLMDNGREGYKIELISVREGMPAIPIRMESEGIIKIISILNALIQAFGNASICLAIDELDAGVFEYILGELLNIFANNAKGQLIFTSHNLRALEMLDKESIMFSTANPQNRYIHMKNIKSTNNLRDVYLRSITLGGQNEVIYSETDSLKIARAFRRAGRSVQNGGQ